MSNVKKAVRADGRLTEKGSDAFQEVLLVSGALKKKVPFNAVLTNDFLPEAGAR